MTMNEEYKAFIKARDTKVQEKEIKFKRIDEPFKIRTITEAENSALKDKNTMTKKEKGVSMPTFNGQAYQRDLTVTSVVYPPIHNNEFQAMMGFEGDALSTLTSILTAGEFQTLQGAVLDFSGFNEDLEEVKNEIKNELTVVD